MQQIARMCRSVWWALAVAGIGALAAAAVVAAGLVATVPATGAWLLVAGAAILVAALRAPDGFRSALPFAGGGVAGLVLGAVAFLLPADESSSAIVSIGLWSLVTGAGCLAVARIAAALRIPDGGLYVVAWAGILAGIGISSLPVVGLGRTTLAAAAALAVTGVIAILAALRLRVLPDEAPPALSKREARRRDRQGS